MSVITLTGENDYLRIGAVRELVKTFKSEHGVEAIERIEGEEISPARLVDLLQARSLFVPERLVIVRDAGANKAIAEQLDEIIEAAGDGVTLVFHEPQLDKRTKFAKTLQKSTDFRDFRALIDQECVKWITTYVNDQGGSISATTVRSILERIGNNQLRLANELDKLLSYDSEITDHSVELLGVVSPQSTIFDLLEAAFSRNHKKVEQIYREQRLEGAEPQQMLAMLGWQMHILLVCKTARSKSSAEIAKDAKLSPYVVQKSIRLIQGVPLSRLKSDAEAILALDVKLKRQAMNADDAVQTLLSQLSRE